MQKDITIEAKDAVLVFQAVFMVHEDRTASVYFPSGIKFELQDALSKAFKDTLENFMIKDTQRDIIFPSNEEQ